MNEKKKQEYELFETLTKNENEWFVLKLILDDIDPSEIVEQFIKESNKND